MALEEIWPIYGVRELTWRSLLGCRALMVDSVGCRCTLTLDVMQVSHP